MKPLDGNLTLAHFPCIMKQDFVAEVIGQCFPCKKKTSFCCLSKEAVSSYEILVLCKGRPSAPLSSVSPNTTSIDMEIKCKRLAGKLYEFIAPEHFVDTLF